ncbi:MAG: hypothetical protein GXP19_10130 [Gammaproteobacteria bacterium]|nr:hypothetical protein [Gammaproteobacteria bacterium]
MDNADVNLAIEGVGLFGSKVGWLYATCCTATRAPMYQSIFKQLNIAHGNMWAILGVDH